MYEQTSKFNKGTRVKLVSSIDPALYGEYACVGNEGIIAGTRKDRFGLPEVLIQWDKNHWAYNGVADCWTYEDHFEPVEKELDMASNKQEQAEALMALFTQGMAQILADQTTAVPPESEPSLAPSLEHVSDDIGEEEMSPEDLAFDQTFEDAMDRIVDSEAFVVLGVDRHPHPKSEQGILEPFALGYSRSPEADVLLAAYMSRVAATAHQDLAVQVITELRDPGSDA